MCFHYDCTQQVLNATLKKIWGSQKPKWMFHEQGNYGVNI
jgi:hypothetical protein